MSPCVCAKSDEKWSRCRNSDSVSPYQSLLPVDAHLAICRGPSPNLSKRITSGGKFLARNSRNGELAKLAKMLRNAPSPSRTPEAPPRFAGGGMISIEQSNDRRSKMTAAQLLHCLPMGRTLISRQNSNFLARRPSLSVFLCRRQRGNINFQAVVRTFIEERHLN